MYTFLWWLLQTCFIQPRGVLHVLWGWEIDSTRSRKWRFRCWRGRVGPAIFQLVEHVRCTQIRSETESSCWQARHVHNKLILTHVHNIWSLQCPDFFLWLLFIVRMSGEAEYSVHFVEPQWTSICLIRTKAKPYLPMWDGCVVLLYASIMSSGMKRRVLTVNRHYNHFMVNSSSLHKSPTGAST